eukprot:m.317142 g.317142  ORF g.317142 m.317142 type:complete len:432 (+) comp16504_c2_seq30:2031-3326(+)
MAALERSFQLDQLLRKTMDVKGTVSQKWDLYLELSELTTSFDLSRESGTSLTSARTELKDFTEFKDWASSGGVIAKNVDIASFGEHGNGLRAESDINTNDVIIQVPTSCMLSTETASQGRLKKLAKSDTMLSQMPNVLLAVHLLSELQDGKSMWQSYIKTLPITFSVPLFYSKEEMKMLKGSPAYEESLTLFISVVRQYVYLQKALKDSDVQKQLGFSAEQFAFKDYKWAVAAVMTRQNRIPVGGTDGNPQYALCLIPYWDMLNHENGVVTSMHDCSLSHTEYKAMRSFKKGDQILMFYGARSNCDLLVHSGFVLEENPHDFLTIKLGVGKADPLSTLKTKLLEALSIPSSGEFTIGKSGELDPQLNAFIRINSLKKGLHQQKGWLTCMRQFATVSQMSWSISCLIQMNVPNLEGMMELSTRRMKSMHAFF